MPPTMQLHRSTPRSSPRPEKPALSRSSSNGSGKGSGKALLARRPSLSSLPGSAKNLLGMLIPKSQLDRSPNVSPTKGGGGKSANASPTKSKNSSPQESSRDVFAGVVEAIAGVASTAGHAPLLASFGFVPPLLAVLQPGAATEPVQVGAARALCLLSQHAACREAIGQAVPTLIALLAPGREALMPAALDILRHLARGSGGMKDTLREAGVLPALVKLLGQKPPPPPHVLASAAQAVRNLAANETNRDALLAAGAVSSLVGLIRASASEPSDLPSAGADALRLASNAALALSNLCVGSQRGKNAVRTAGGVAWICRLLDCGPGPAAAATEAIGNMSVKNKANKDAVRTEGGCKALALQFRLAHVAEIDHAPLISRRSGAARGSSSPSRTSSAPPSGPPSFPSSVHSSRRPSGGSNAGRPSGVESETISMPTSPCSSSGRGSSPPGPGERASGASVDRDGANSPAPPSIVPAERTAWALRNLIAGHGLNAAEVTAVGIPLKLLEPPPTGALPAPRPAAGGFGGAMMRAAGASTSRDARAAAAAQSLVGETSGGVAHVVPLAIRTAPPMLSLPRSPGARFGAASGAADAVVARPQAGRPATAPPK